MTSIYEEHWRQRSDLVEASKEPISISFSSNGYQQAMAETDASSLQRWGMQLDDMHWTSYCGLPFKVVPQQTSPIIVEWEADYDKE